MEAPPSLSPSNNISPLPTQEAAATSPLSINPLVVKAQEDTVRKFASLLSSDSKAAKTPPRSQGLSSLLADSLADDSVILTLPSLDLRYSENSDGASPLPKIGEKKNIQGEDADATESADASSSSRPNMMASVLAAASADETAQKSNGEIKSPTSQLKATTSWTKSTLIYASHALATNVTDFFSNLVDSRVKAWTLLLLRHSLSTGDTESRARLLGMLSTSISVHQAETNFKTLSMPTSTAGQRKEADVILPLLFEVTLQLSIQDNLSTVKLLAPGTISADFVEAKASEGALKKVLINLDTGVMLSSMIDQARLIVFKAVANVTKAKLPPSMPAAGTGPTREVACDKPLSQADSSRRLANATRLTGFRSSLGLSTAPVADATPTLQKARDSALRLNSILLGKQDKQSNSAQLGLRKGRSIQWSSPAQLPTIPAPLATKKQRMAENAAKLTSIKSFGRPHGGDFGSGPRNATFGEYGQGMRMWGRDGRMAHHPLPMQNSMGVDNVGLTGLAERNATFDLTRASATTTMPTAGRMGTASALPRTATGLENWLLKTSTAGHNR